MIESLEFEVQNTSNKINVSWVPDNDFHIIMVTKLEIKEFELRFLPPEELFNKYVDRIDDKVANSLGSFWVLLMNRGVDTLTKYNKFIWKINS